MHQLRLTEYLKMKRTIQTTLLILFLQCLVSCSESPHIDFHSYQELSGYNFIGNGWFPEILGRDAINIQATYDMATHHVYGKFDFKNRASYDSIIQRYHLVRTDSILAMITEIRKPRYPSWFIPKEEITDSNYVVATHEDFYLLMDKKRNNIYFVR